MENKTLTSIKGVKVGNSTHLDKLTGCTLIFFEKELPVAYKSYGGAPGTFNTDIFQNGKTYPEAQGIFIAGGSFTGLLSAAGIMQTLIKKKLGHKDANIINPSLTGAIVFDLGAYIEEFSPEYGEEAFKNLTTKPVKSGNVGAGTGVTIGKFQYLEKGTKNGGMKSGLGSGRVNLGNGVVVCALSVVNALGNVINPDGSILAGNRDEIKKFKTFEDTKEFVTTNKYNTTISVVGINIDLGSRENYEKVAHAATHGQVRAINPVHTTIDGDTVFVFSTKEKKSLLNERGKYFETPKWSYFSVDLVGQAAAKAVQDSIYDACKSAESIAFAEAYKGIIPSVKDYK